MHEPLELSLCDFAAHSGASVSLLLQGECGETSVTRTQEWPASPEPFYWVRSALLTNGRSSATKRGLASRDKAGAGASLRLKTSAPASVTNPRRQLAGRAPPS